MISQGTMISHDTTATRTPVGAIPDIVPIGPTTIRFSLTTALGANALVLTRIRF